MTVHNISRLRTFVQDLAGLVETAASENALLKSGAPLLHDLVSHDDWLPDAFAQPDPVRYRQYLLHCDSAERFSVVSFVWGPGQSTPIHNHTVWGLVGVLRGAELAESFDCDADQRLVLTGAAKRLDVGDVETLSPTIGDIHRVSNVYNDRTSISIHVYGANIGAVTRSTFDIEGRNKRFISGYHNVALPNLWDRSSETVEA